MLFQKDYSTRATLPTLPMTALLRNLARMTASTAIGWMRAVRCGGSRFRR